MISFIFFSNLIQIDLSSAQLNYSQKKNSNQQQTSSAATRGCRSQMPKLKLLAPSNELANVGKEQTFLLNISNSAKKPLQVSILEPYVPNPVWKNSFEIKKAGLISISLPKTIKLKPNTDYIFTATIACNLNNPSDTIYVRTFFQYREIQAMEKANPVKPNISFLLAEGIWYDALWIAYKNQLPQFEQLLKMQNIELED